MKMLLRALAADAGLREADVRKLLSTAPERYKIYYIDKKRGGQRQIAQPTSEIKFLQRIFAEKFLSHLPIHESATAYRRGYSILDNARRHDHSGPILKMDLKDFFPSIRGRDWISYCIKHRVFEDMEDIYLSERLLFFRPPGGRLLRLAIGAPSSPMLSNVLMFEFDDLLSNLVRKDRVIYTRYADDLTFSAPRTGFLVKVKRDVASVIRDIKFPKLDINDEKTTYVTKKYHRTITGLTISNDSKVTLGRDRKRLISASIHRVLIGGIDDVQLARIAGLIAFANVIEPAFVQQLGEKYGSDVRERSKRFGAKARDEAGP
jgi:RNA-directed DNA polymerase